MATIYARQAISTKYLGPTNARGARVKATSGSGLTLTISWDHALDVADNHAAAARALASKLGWSGRWAIGTTRDGYAAVHVTEGTTFNVRKSKAAP